MINNICIVLENTSHPGNIGASARAMYTMGINQLRLILPKKFPHPDATAQASGALEVINNARIFENVAEALADSEIVFGTSARVRDFPWPVVTPQAAAAKISQQFHGNRIAILFGTERYGLNNQALERCHYLIQIPTVKNFSSLNLAQAVQIICYEIYVALDCNKANSSFIDIPARLASSSSMDAFYLHLQNVLEHINFLNPAAPRLLMRRLKRLCHRAQLEPEELQILRGMLTAVMQKIPKVEHDN